MGAAGRARAEEFSWERVTAKVDDYYGLVIRRLAARGELPRRVPRRDPAVATPRRARSGHGEPAVRWLGRNGAVLPLPDEPTPDPVGASVDPGPG